MESLFDRLVARVPIRTGLGIAATIRLLDPIALVRELWIRRDLISQLSRRDVAVRYRGSYLGIAWSLLNPLFLLAVYTLVFSSVFKARWGLEDEGTLDFALVLFCGLTVFGIFAECVGRSPGLILSSSQYVKKVKFPLYVLPVVITISALAHAILSFVILVVAVWIAWGFVNWTLVLLPISLFPLVMLCLGVSWFLSALGVFVRDISHVTNLLITALLFLSPIFYPVSAIPLWLQPLHQLNPLSIIIEQVRAVTIWGRTPDWFQLAAVSALTFGLALCGYAWFERTREGFADVM
ncbi:MAG TPA: ABC transporter permease [Vicinamibacteria bacterium]|nr:ABC transporter permease [Vicinamibacteria bacterium]